MVETRNRIWKLAAPIMVLFLLAGCNLFDDGGAVPDVSTSLEGSVYSLQISDCFNEATLSQGNTITDVPTIECSEPHDYEAIKSVPMDDSMYPGEAETTQRAEEECEKALSDFASTESTLDYTYFYPTEASWDGGDREILCIAYDSMGPMTGPAAKNGDN